MNELKDILIKNNWMTEKEINTVFTSEIEKCIKERTTPKNKKHIFNSFTGLLPEQVKVLIIGQDPYPDEQRAHGLAFSFGDGKPAEDSLKNIFTKIENELGIKNINTDLTCWKKQGVLLLNTALTFNKDSQNSHLNLWKNFISKIISTLLEVKNKTQAPLVIMLWGRKANELKDLTFAGTKEKDEEIFQNKYPNIKIIRCSHPSNNYNSNNKPIFSGKLPSFSDCEIFKPCNEFLKKHNTQPINWQTD